MFEIKVSHRFAKDAKSLPKTIKDKIPGLLEHMGRNPVPVEQYDVKKMKGERSIYRIRLGDYRLIYSVDFLKKEIILLKIGKRENIYDR